MKYEINKIYNEDSYIAIKDIPDNSIDLVIIDPPYKYESGGFGNSELGERKGKQKEDFQARGLYDGFDISILDDIIRVMKKVNIYIWCSKKQIEPILKYFWSLDKEINFDILTWHKTNPAPSANMVFLNDTEYCFNFREKGCIIGGDYADKRKYWVTPINKYDKDLYGHPTIKPLEIIEQLIRISSKENDVVADFFLGSGTTCVGAKELNRQYIGFEKEKEFFDIAEKRLKGMTNNGQISIFSDLIK